MTYQEALNYLDSFINYEKIGLSPYKRFFKLRRIGTLLERLGHPEKKFPSLHVAGTKGKGSVCAYLFSVCKEANLKCGLYSSPHLVSFRERIRLGKKSTTRLITEQEISSLAPRLKKELDYLSRRKDLGELSFFEVYTALAFVFFAKQSVDLAIIETGLGGRLDATNVIKPKLSIITPVSYDHTDCLGKTLSLIAREKAGIIKRKTPVVSSRQRPAARRLIREISRKKGATLYEAGRDFSAVRTVSKTQGQRFNYRGIDSRMNNLKIPLLGPHQIENAALALAGLEILRRQDLAIEETAIRKGLSEVSWPGRMEIAGKRPYLVLDGAQNRASAVALKKAIKEISFRRLFLILGMSRDKDVKGLGRELLPRAKKVFLTVARTPRAHSAVELERRLRDFSKNLILTRDTGEALGLARKAARREDMILVAGSLYIVGEIREILGKKIL